MKNKVGPPVIDEDFFGREKEIEFALNLINDGNSLLLAAPRRVGKSSFAKKLLSISKKKGWRTMELNLEKVNTEQQFIRFFVEELTKMNWLKNVTGKIKDQIDNILNQIDIEVEYNDIKGSLSWKEKRKKVFDDLENLFDHSSDTLIMIDELGVLLTSYKKNAEYGITYAENLLSWFRDLTQVSNTKIRWVFCSSIGIRNFTNRHNISYTINVLENYPLKSFSKENSEKMLYELARGKDIDLPQTVIESILQKIDWYLPYFIQLMFKQVHYLNFVEEKPLNEDTVYAAYLNLTKSTNFDTWDERLDHYYEMEDISRRILKSISNNVTGISRSSIFDLVHQIDSSIEQTDKVLGQIIGMLTNDGYIYQNEDKKYVFRSPLLRDYWKNKFTK